MYVSHGEYYEEKESKLRLICRGEIHLTSQRIIIDRGKQEHILDLLDVDAATIESNNKLQLYQAKDACLIQIRFSSSSALLWQDMIVLILERFFHKTIITR